MTITENFIGGAITVISVFSYGHFFNSDFLFDIHFSVVICDFLVKSSNITIVLMHVSFIIHYKNNLIDKKDSYLISCPPCFKYTVCFCHYLVGILVFILVLLTIWNKFRVIIYVAAILIYLVSFLINVTKLILQYSIFTTQ